MSDRPIDLVRSEKAFDGRLFDVALRTYRHPDGGEYEREVVEHPGAVGIVAHDERFVYLVSQPREAIDSEASLEIPAGTRDVEGESELECAIRELREEVGLAAESWELLRTVHLSPGWANEQIAIFEATGLSEVDGGHQPDDDEELEVVRLPLGDLDRTLDEIEDAKTLIGLLLLSRKLG
jgi:8-oxo-dGTP pyrophosphatase MutT (NUDIX family)